MRLACLPIVARADQTASEVLEEGDIFFFYRPRVEVEEVKGREDVQRLFMILAPRRPRSRPFRVLVIGRKKLPEVIPDRAHPEERNWATVVLVTDDPEEVRRELGARHYVTQTRGERILAAAKPVGEGRYQIVRHGDHTELAYVLELPERPSVAQDELEIKKEASFIVAVRNPDMPQPPGVPAPRAQPEYPKHLREKFGSHRWIPVDEVELLNFPNTQILLIGARADSVQEELGIRIDEERESLSSAEVFRRLHLDRKEIPLEPLFKGEFPSQEMPPTGARIEEMPAEETPGRGGRARGRAAAATAPSAAAVAKVLGGISFPQRKQGLIDWAERHRNRLERPESVLDVLRQMPDRTYTSMADVERALGEIR